MSDTKYDWIEFDKKCLTPKDIPILAKDMNIPYASCKERYYRVLRKRNYQEVVELFKNKYKMTNDEIKEFDEQAQSNHVDNDLTTEFNSRRLKLLGKAMSLFELKIMKEKMDIALLDSRILNNYYDAELKRISINKQTSAYTEENSNNADITDKNKSIAVPSGDRLLQLLNNHS